MKNQVLFPIMAFCFVIFTQTTFSQVLVSDNPAAVADNAAMLDVQSTSRGFLFPRMTQAQRNAITSPPTSMIIFQTDNTPGLYYNTGTAGSPNWVKVTDASTVGGYWTQSGSNLYYNTGNVGIGTSSPSTKLHVSGSVWAYDSIYVTGRPGKLFIDGETNYSPMIRWSYEGTSMFYQDIWNITGAFPYWSMSSDEADDFWMIRKLGRLWHNYQGIESAHVIKTAAPSRALSIENTSATGESRGIQVSMSNTGNPTGILAVGGWAYGQGTGVYGMNVAQTVPETKGNFGHVGSYNHGMYGEHWPSENRGSLGASSYGAYGRSGETNYSWGALGLDGATDWAVYGAQGTGSTPNFGGIATANYGVYGEYGAEDFFGVLGFSSAAVYGQLGNSSQNLSDGDYAIKGIGVLNSSESGSGYGYNATIGGVVGWNQEGRPYSFGVAGYTQSQANRSGGVFGYGTGSWGSLGYRDNSGTNYGGYFTSTTTGAGKSSSGTTSSIGIGVFGDLFGAHITGNVYGLYSEGTNYSIYAKGDMYRTGADVHLQTSANGQNSVMYTLVTPEMTIQTYGIGQMQNGKSSIEFDDAFAGVVSENEPIIVTITPIGKSEGVYLDKVDANGFSVGENNNGKSNVQFSWIAIGKRTGYENMSLPADVIASDYNEKIQRGLANDADPDAQGEGLYYQNGTLINGIPVQARTAANEVAIELAKNLEPFAEDKNSSERSPTLKDEKEDINAADEKIK